MTWDLHDYRLITASAYPGLMGPLASHPSCVCILSGDADEHKDQSKVATVSLERVDGVRRRWRFGDVARLADFVPNVLAESGPDPRPLLLIPPRVSPAWEAAAAAWSQDVRLVGRPAGEVGRIAENKIFVRERLRALGVPTPKFFKIDASELSYQRLADALGTPFVLQAPNGAGGQGTYLVTDEQHVLRAVCDRPDVGQWLASAYAGDVTISVSAVVYDDAVRIMPASLQVSNIAEAGVGFGDYCGSEFGIDVPPGVYQHAEKVAWWLHETGHRGLFGADVAVSGHEIAFLEINPRILGSSWLLSRAQQRAGLPQVLEQHVLALLGHAAPPDAGLQCGRASSLILRWRGEAGVVRAVPAPMPGLTALPRIGTMVLPGAIMARLESTRSLAAPGGTALLPDTARTVARLWDAFDVRPPFTTRS
ncbi:ATP-grasp domain-containing protein [Allorhizocola rhizosphaerae]|uniref:ATP-grasp domain-containing protein n=1 Tax=Allorhizocola rhizosphaerae TaxID=1872709 RepID=UPI000E3C4D3C|nr:ATP-grasp domain-containing protein [Allorhizocola rhizosphaerae]